MPPTDDSPTTGPVSTDDSPSRDAIRRVVADALPDTEIRNVGRFEAGTNAVYAVDVESGVDDAARTSGDDAPPHSSETVDREADCRRLVLKVGDHDFAAGCRAEPTLLERVADRTEIPVPAVLDTGHLGDDPYFLAERIPGVNPAFDPARLAPEQFERVCVDAGRNLGELHAAFPADGWGMLGRERGADDLHFVREFPDWPTYFEAWLTHNVERLADTRFGDLVPALSDRAADAVDELRAHGPFEPVVTHGDYRLGNLLVDPDTGATNGVVDWATPTAVTAVHDLVVTEALLLDWPEVAPDRQRRLRERFYDGYRETNPELLDWGTDDGVLDRERFEARRRLCRFGARLRLAVNLHEEMTGRSDDAVDARAREHRDALAEFGVE